MQQRVCLSLSAFSGSEDIINTAAAVSAASVVSLHSKKCHCCLVPPHPQHIINSIYIQERCSFFDAVFQSISQSSTLLALICRREMYCGLANHRQTSLMESRTRKIYQKKIATFHVLEYLSRLYNIADVFIAPPPPCFLYSCCFRSIQRGGCGLPPPKTWGGELHLACSYIYIYTLLRTPPSNY